MKRDLKSANVNFEIVKYVVDDCLMNTLKKANQKVQKWLSQGILKLAVQTLHFEKNDFEIYELDFRAKINSETFYAQNYSQKVRSRNILNRPIHCSGLFYTKKAPSYTSDIFLWA